MKQRKLISILLSLSLLFTACEKNDIEKINFLNNDKDYPDIIGSNVEVIYSDSAKVKVKMTAPSLKQFNQAKKPYSEFPEGMNVEFYNDSLQLESEIQADYAIYYTEERLWHAKGNVIAKNIKTNERLDSEELYWNEEKEEIYSESYTKIVNENGTFYGENGFQSD
jgi:LPS export ABC transporter protein LptC